ncbi:MAG: aminopeptidase P family protein [Pseudomonadota bacterium]
MTDDMVHVAHWHYGDKSWSPFSAEEMARRQKAMRGYMADHAIDAVLFTSYHGVCYYSGFLYCQFGRRYGFVLTGDQATTVAAAIDGGQPWRRTFGNALTYTDWRKDSYFSALKQLMPGVRRLGVEFDHVSLDLKEQLEAAFPGIELVDIAAASMTMRLVKSPEEHALIREGARICEIGGQAVVDAVAPDVSEHEVALAATGAMVREIAGAFPFVELMDTWTWFQSGPNTDGAHNPVTNRRIEAGDILSLNTFPMIFGYYTALERTLFCGHASDAHLDLWDKNCAVHRHGLSLIRPGRSCAEIALELNTLYRDWDLLKYRSFGYGHSFGVLSHYYGREAGLELREDCETVLEPGMVVSMEPMIMIPEGQPGAGGYREHDLLIVTDDGADLLTTFPFGPEHNIVPLPAA